MNKDFVIQDDNLINHTSNATVVTVQDSVTSIEVSAFYNCKSLTSIAISNSFISIIN